MDYAATIYTFTVLKDIYMGMVYFYPVSNKPKQALYSCV